MPTTGQAWVEAGFQHSEEWGKVWFGLVFWGSVINAIAQGALPHESAWLVATASYAVGLGLGALAKARGVWL